MDKLNKKLEEYLELKQRYDQVQKELTTEMLRVEEAQLGTTYYEYVANLKSHVEEDGMIVDIEGYKMCGTIETDSIIIQIMCNVYAEQEIFGGILEYKGSGRLVREIPKKYEAEFNRLKEFCVKQKIKFDIRELAGKHNIYLS